MSHPPDEPPPGDGEAWQSPGPPPPPPPPPPPSDGQNPYGGGTTSPYHPIDSGGMSSAAKIVLGVLIGLFGGFFLWLFAAILFAGVTNASGSDNAFLFWAAVAPLLVPAPLLIWRATRPWAVGLLIGTAVCSIGLSSLCSSVIGTPV